MNTEVPSTLKNSDDQLASNTNQLKISQNRYDRTRALVLESIATQQSSYQRGEISEDRYADFVGKMHDVLIRLDKNEKNITDSAKQPYKSPFLKAMEQKYISSQENMDRKEFFLTMERVNKAHWDISRGLEGNSSRSVRAGEVQAMMKIKRESKTDAAVEEGILQFEVQDYINKFKAHFNFSNPESEGQWAKKSYFDSSSYGYPIETFIGRHPLSNVQFNSGNRKTLNSILVGIYLNHPEAEKQLFNFMATMTGAVDTFKYFEPKKIDVEIINSFKNSEAAANNIVSSKNLKPAKSVI